MPPPGTEVQVGFAQVADLLQACPAQPDAWLGEHELARLSSLSGARRRAQYLAGRWLARTLLDRVAGCPAGGWQLSAPSNAPSLVLNLPSAGPLHFSISHSGPHVACAVAGQPVGLDIEPRRLVSQLEDKLDLVCTSAQNEAVRSEPGPGPASDLFLQYWTLKESWIKRHPGPGEPPPMHRIAAGLCAIPQDANARSWLHQDVWFALSTEGVAHTFRPDGDSALERLWTVSSPD
ncbi:MAG: 4'-phosphopantetheinyl transferase superfamily protein [Ramlibacter sp.]|nr:4'-phosphopantetheinyl transferase superfamily protein [Ramlibacter sp.]